MKPVNVQVQIFLNESVKGERWWVSANFLILDTSQLKMVRFLLYRGMDTKNIKAKAGLLTTLVFASPAFKAIAETVAPPPEKPPAGTIYKSVDSEGNVVFTDKPGNNPNAVEIKTQPINVADPGPSSQTANSEELEDGANDPATESAKNDADAEKIAIDSVSIVSPQPDATLIDIPGPLFVGLQTEPVSIEESGLTAEVYVDGKLAVSGTKSLLAVSVPERGTHTLLVKLVDKDGRTQAASATQNVHIKKRVVANGN